MSDIQESTVEETVVEDTTVEEPTPEPTRTENNIVEDIVEDLSVELSATDDDFNVDVLIQKVRQALREVKTARKYPSTYTSAMVVADLDNYYSDIRNIALYDYNHIGGEFQTTHDESSVKRIWCDRDKLFNGIYPLARF